MGEVILTEDTFGKITDGKGKNRTVRRFTWQNKSKFSVQVIDYGGYITSIKVPDKDGNIKDITIGFDTVEKYLQPYNRYFGATIGRVANRIGKAKMIVEGVTYNLANNNGPHHLHGGKIGFDKVFWEACIQGTRLILSYHSADMEENYPGDLIANVIFELTKDNEFRIDYKAVTTKPCPVNFTNHSYFNLAGNGAGAQELYKHNVCINADKITEVDGGIPTGNLLPVQNTVFDLRVPKELGQIINKVPNSPGFDNNFCITKGTEQGNTFVASVYHPTSGRLMEVYSDQPGVQFYTSNFLPEDDTVMGKDGYIKKHGGFCLETQKYPDSVNNENFPNTIVYPGEQYHHSVVFKFSLK
ncbi:galactose mutarotase-like [Diorhabda sublineata]|uniref:galactose mutarotase-like n=1 Tax=Diorhabda sublineata TaxID=1163346 RepID=UPI0024E0CB28|nr:galactose mutarotase-like [Diorhabda sublineata]